MKTAFSSFIYSRRGIYGILHILILLMSLFLVISISIDTFHNIPFLNQGSYLKIQFWICMFFLFDFLLEFFLSKEKGRYFTSHFIFLLVSIPYLNIIDFYHITFSPEISYFLRFIPLLRGLRQSMTVLLFSRYLRVCAGYRGGLAVGQQGVRAVYLVHHHADGHRVFCQPYLLCAGT
jgi:hypothetical protein